MGSLLVTVIGSIIIMNSFININIFCVFCVLFIRSNTGMEIPAEIEEMEHKAFAICDYDRMVGLTWKEVEKCEERFAAELSDQNITIPTKEDFENADLNQDGTLLFEEWEEFVMGEDTEEEWNPQKFKNCKF